MRRYYQSNYVLFLATADLALTCISLFLAGQARFILPYGVRLTEKMVTLPLVVYAAAAVIWGVNFVLFSVYDRRRLLRIVDEAQLVTAAVAMSNLVLAGLLYLTYRDVPRLLFVYFVVLDVFFLLMLRLTLRIGFRIAGARRMQEVRVLIVGAGKVGRQVAQEIQTQSWTGLTLVGYLDDDPTKQESVLEGAPVLGQLEAANRLVQSQRIDEVILALPLRAHGPLEDLVLALQTLPVRVRVVPDFFDLAIFRATIEDFGGIPLIGLRDPAIDGYNRTIKRAFDLVIATLGLLLVWPIMLLVAVAIKLDSPGPVFFKQSRVGENARVFTMIKFRSMVVDAEQRQAEVMKTTDNGVVMHKTANDPRITRVGHFIRRTSLDEIPQLFNVLKGDMSLVGPRPELPFLVERYERWQRQRFAVPPGITGWWQINGRSDKLMHLHTEDDLYYIRNYSPLLDLQILWRTIAVVLRGRGAY
ncbi:undecaprenyl-phosphate glucose phosphotransferase [Candidatus Amarolinea aalborgensis]|uniref:undecaprenyl-phosphate glucose phosphotransferase n=1 Tax=Candidatus Amarolinea aalborgensis TaxID=2249329 RepID=UPI003BF995F8